MPLFSFFSNLFKKIKQGKQKQAVQGLDKKLVASITPWQFPRFSQFKFLPTILNRKEKWLVKMGFFIALVAYLAFAVSFIKNPQHQIPAEGGIFREAVVGYPRFINPVLASSETDKDLSRFIYSSLMAYDEQGLLSGDLAKSFETSPDGRVYTFLLKDASWQDGEPVVANDVVFTIKTIQNPDWRSPLWRVFRNILVEAVDDRTVKFTLDKPFASFPSLLTVGILPAHIWQSVNPDNLSLAVWNIQPVGSGPWQFQNFTKTKDGQLLSYTLEKNPGYYGQKPWLAKITFFFYQDFESAIQALKESLVDSLPFIPQTSKEKLPLKRVNLYPVGLPIYTAVFFNERKNDLLAIKQIRQALNLSINKKELADKINGELVSGPLFSSQTADVPSFLQNNFDEAKTTELFQKAGYQLKNNLWQKKDKTIAISLTLLDDPLYLQTAEFIKTAWEKNGVKISLNALDAKDFKQAVKNRNYEALLWSQILNRDPDLFPFWHSSQIDDPGLNLTSWRNRAGDVLLETARTATDSAKKWSLYLDFQKILSEESPAIFLYRPVYLYAVAKKVGGVKLDNLNSPFERFAGINNWFVNKNFKW